jgi:hypothetical protein
VGLYRRCYCADHPQCQEHGIAVVSERPWKTIFWRMCKIGED